MKDFLIYLLKKIIDNPDDLKVEEIQISETMSQFNISANKDDMGKIIGKEGKIIQAVRNIVKILAIKEGKQVRIEIA